MDLYYILKKYNTEAPYVVYDGSDKEIESLGINIIAAYLAKPNKNNPTETLFTKFPGTIISAIYLIYTTGFCANKRVEDIVDQILSSSDNTVKMCILVGYNNYITSSVQSVEKFNGGCIIRIKTDKDERLEKRIFKEYTHLYSIIVDNQVKQGKNISELLDLSKKLNDITIYKSILNSNNLSEFLSLMSALTIIFSDNKDKKYNLLWKSEENQNINDLFDTFISETAEEKIIIYDSSDYESEECDICIILNFNSFGSYPEGNIYSPIYSTKPFLISYTPGNMINYDDKEFIKSINYFNDITRTKSYDNKFVNGDIGLCTCHDCTLFVDIIIKYMKLVGEEDITYELITDTVNNILGFVNENLWQITGFYFDRKNIILNTSLENIEIEKADNILVNSNDEKLFNQKEENKALLPERKKDELLIDVLKGIKYPFIFNPHTDMDYNKFLRDWKLVKTANMTKMSMEDYLLLYLSK